ncbi:MAG: phospholipase, partial [Chitinophagaceae bacterium]
TKWWVFHGAKDDVVQRLYSDIMVDALRKTKATVKYTIYPDANHNSWDPAFAEPTLLNWLFSQSLGKK